ncbi:hypothetical protein V8C35DRAFT_41320 [Trichoderma chlorosporum]
MEGRVSRAAVDSAPPTFLSFCTICQKPFTQEYSFNRHVSYCRRASAKRKSRPRACLRCHTSKTKCSLAKPQCSRCQAQGLECTYDQPTRRPLIVDDSVIERQQTNSPFNSTMPHSESLEPGTSHCSATALHNGGRSYTVDTNQGADERAASRTSSSQLTSSTTQTTSTWQPVTEPGSSAIYQTDILNSSYPMTVGSIHPGGFSLNFAVNQLAHAIYAFPQMMMRRQTFPPFIHGHWHLQELPETLANCMSISQIYAARSPETKPFLWRMIGAELQRFESEAENASASSLQLSLQAIMQFIIMVITEHDAIALDLAPKLIKTFHILCMRTRALIGNSCFTYFGDNIPDVTWEQWIFAETRRRVICLWFFMSRIVSPSAGSAFIRAYPPNMLPLVSNKSLWEARSREEWETEKALHDASYPMTTFDELVEAKRRSHEPFYRRRLETWDAGVDKLGMLINIATDLM